MAQQKRSPLYTSIRKATQGVSVTLEEISPEEVQVEGSGAYTASRLIETYLLNQGKGYFVEYFRGQRPKKRGFATFTVRKHDRETMYTA